MTVKKPRPPAHLGPEARKWWTAVVTDYALEGHHLKLLQAAAECWERLQQARATIAEQGATFQDDRGNYRAHPSVAIERDARIGFARLVRELDLDVEPPAPGRRPPGLRSNSGRV
jgi:phage terminase small subunit